MKANPAPKNKDPKNKILLLHNSQNYDVFRDALSFTLEHLGCEITECTNWDELTENRELEQYDLALVDPRADGYSDSSAKNLSERVNGSGPNLVSIRLHEEDDQRDFEAMIRARAFVFKTYLPHELFFTFMRVLPGPVANGRKAPRALSSFAVEYRGLGSKQWEYDRCFNISQGGLFLQSYRNRSHAGFLNLILHLPDRSLPMHCEAHVVHRRKVCLETSPYPPGMGLEFINLNRHQARRLEGFVSERLFPIDYSS